MIRVTVTSDVANARDFIVQVEGNLRSRKSLNDALGRSLARMLQEHFRVRNTEPNKMQAPKTNFWNQVRDATVMTEATDSGATVRIAEQRFGIHLFGGTVKPTGGRKFLTIPIIKEARARSVAEYENQTRRKLFRLPFGRVLFERDEQGNRSFTGRERVTVRGNRGQYNSITIRERSRVRPVYALKQSVTIQKDPRALPESAAILRTLQDTADKWAARTMARRKGGPA